MVTADTGETQSEQDCPVCAQLRHEGPRPDGFSVSPAAGGGWHQWGASLARLFDRIGLDPTQVVIVDQRPFTMRYVQFLIGHGQAHAEASSNVYLLDDSRLSPEQEALLARLGWRSPADDVDVAEEMPANWTLPLVRGDWHGLAEVVLATVAGVFGFSEHLPVNIETFQADHPCMDCFPEMTT